MIFKFETNDFLRDGIGCEDTKVRADRAAELAQLALEKHLAGLPKVFMKVLPGSQSVVWSTVKSDSSRQAILFDATETCKHAVVSANFYDVPVPGHGNVRVQSWQCSKCGARVKATGWAEVVQNEQNY